MQIQCDQRLFRDKRWSDAVGRAMEPAGGDGLIERVIGGLPS